MITSGVYTYHGVPTLHVNGVPECGMSYITYFEERNCYGSFASCGYRLFTFATFFGDQTINETSHVSPFSPGIFRVEGESDFSSFDRCMEDILAACPEAYVFPRVNMSLPRWWEESHPEACNDRGSSSTPEHCRACFSSLAWREQSAVFLRELIRHVESSPWCDHVVGYQIASGNTEEWFPFDQRGSVGEASRRAFAAAGGSLEDIVRYRRFLSEQVADAIIYLGGVAKEATGHRLAIGSFYGYTLETPWWQSCHMALNRILDSDSIDFLCSPASYMKMRQPGIDVACMTVLDSLKLHGKAYFVELDLRTHLSRPLNQCRPGGALPGTYDRGIWLGPSEPETCAWQLRAAAGRQLTHGYWSWWFDMWGGWYESELLMGELEALRRLGERSMDFADRRSLSEVAVFVDEECYSLLEDEQRPLARQICYDGRLALGLCGVPYDIYAVRDLDQVMERYRCAVMLAPAMTDGMRSAIHRCRDLGKGVLVYDAGHPEVTTEELRRFYGEHGVHQWLDTEDVLHASRDLLVIQASAAGKKTIHLPSARRVRGLLPETPSLGETREVEVELRQFETRIFQLE